MIIIDKALEERDRKARPIRVAVIGAGFMGRGLALQIIGVMRGMRLVAVSNRTVSQAERAYREAGVDTVKQVDSIPELEKAIQRGEYCVTDNALLLCESDGIDAIVEATGEVEYGARIVLKAIEHGKHVILMNAELDALVGPILKVYADRAGVIITNVDGDQPGVVMNLLRFVRSIGYNPVLAGNIKGLQDPYRTPETQRGFAEKHHQKPRMITSFADGTKLSMEMAVVANATGFKVGRRGMYGPKCAHVTEAASLFPPEQMLNGGLVDYVLGAEPGPGVFVIGYNDHPTKRQYMHYLKMGDGPFYVFYVPYHLPHLEAPLTVARAVLFNDAATAPLGSPVADVLTVAKRDLRAGEELDGIGGFTCYGTIDNAEIVSRENLLPMSLAEGCRLNCAVKKDQAITYADILRPSDRVCDRLRSEQNKYFAPHRDPASVVAN